MEKNGNNNFQIHCTWRAVDEKNISEAVTWTDANENPDIEEMIQAENCLLLESEVLDGAGSECRIILFCQAPYFIQQVSVLCEARLIEVYGKHSEYIKTIRNDMVDEVDDMIVFRGDIKLERPTVECSLKFTGLKSKSSMWLYGITVKLGTSLLSPNNNALLNHHEGISDRNQKNNAQFMSVMNSLFGAQQPSPQAPVIPPVMMPNQQMWQPNLGEQSQASNLGSTAAQSGNPTAQLLQKLLQPQMQQPQMQMGSVGGPDLITMLMSAIQNPYAQQQMQQQNQKNLVDLFAQLQTNPVNPTATPVIAAPNQVLPTNATKSGTDSEPQVEVATEPQIKAEVIKPEMPQAVNSTSTAIELTQTEAQPQNATIKEPEQQIRELAVELRPETVDQITEAVINNIDCSLENLEARLWGKIVHRLSEMETRILGRMEEVVDALREEEEEMGELIEEDEEALSGEGSELQI